MTPVQILTQESIEKIERAITALEQLGIEYPNMARESINDLKQIIKEVKD